MHCSNCNTPLAPGAHFCPGCGAQIAQPVYAASPYPGLGRVARHLRSLGLLWYVYAVLRFFSGLAKLFFLEGLFGHRFGDSLNFGWNPIAMGWMHALWPVTFLSLLISVGCAVLTGYALATRQPWGRIFAIIFAIFALFNLPFGTALGIYTLWVLAPRLSGLEYDALTANTPQP